jgi:hypothetical protein
VVLAVRWREGVKVMMTTWSSLPLMAM